MKIGRGVQIMADIVLVAIISGSLTLIGTGLTVWASSRKTTQNYEVHQAVMDEKIQNLTDEVRKHNGFAEKIPVLTERIDNLQRRVNELEKEG